MNHSADQSPYHYPPELFALLVDTIPRLCRSKQDVITFFRGAGTPADLVQAMRQRLDADRSVSKFDLARHALAGLNERGDTTLGPRREVLKRVTEFEDYSTCWPNDELKAKGLVAEIRRVVNVKDSFTRMSQAHDRERDAARAQQTAELAAAAARREARRVLYNELTGLFTESNPHKRGTLLEDVLNRLFALDGLLIREAFALRNEDGQAGEQLDGVIELDGHQYLVEMKWWADKLGKGAVAQHLVRVYGRADVRGLLVSASGFTQPAIDECTGALRQKVFVLSELRELILLLERDDDVAKWLREKVRKATVERIPLWVAP